MDHLALLGQDISQSRSQEIYTILSDMAGIDLCYDLIDGPLDDRIWKNITAQGYYGFNVTKPHKRTLFAMMDHLSDAARASGAVNVIKRIKDGSFHGHNTDQEGLLWDLRRLAYLKNQPKILIIGAGGAVYNIMAGLAKSSPHPVALYNRTYAHALEVAEHFNTLPIQIIEDPSDIHGFDVVIYASSSEGPYEAWLKGACFKHALVYDLQYQVPTPFMQYALHHGAGKAHGGLGMLVAQACYAMEFWYGRTFEPLALMRALKA